MKQGVWPPGMRIFQLRDGNQPPTKTCSITLVRCVKKPNHGIAPVSLAQSNIASEEVLGLLKKKHYKDFSWAWINLITLAPRALHRRVIMCSDDDQKSIKKRKKEKKKMILEAGWILQNSVRDSKIFFNLWWSHCKLYNCQITMLYTWDEYNVAHQLYFNKKGRKKREEGR